MNIIEYENYQERRYEQPGDFPYLTYPCSIPYDFSEVPLHWHDEIEFIYIKKGACLVSLDHTDYHVHAGDLLFINPGQLHAIRQRNQESVEYENIIFHPRLLSASQSDSCWNLYLAPVVLHKSALPALVRPDSPHYKKIASCIDQIDEIRRSFPAGYELFIKGKLFELFFLFYHHNMVVTRTASPAAGKSLEKTRQIIKYIEQHYTDPLSIKEMAEASGFSQSHFMKFFKQTFGMSFTVYLNTYRLTMASRLLLSSEDSILTVAGACGFENLSYFNRLFRRKFGMTPRQFRQRT